MKSNAYSTVYKVSHSGGSGSCFYLKSDDVFVTNHHVIEGQREVALESVDGEVLLAKVFFTSPSLDIALLAAESSLPNMTALRLAKGTPSLGEAIRVAGFPLGMPFSVTEGTVTAPRQRLDGQEFIQTDAAINPGNSGGPLLNAKDEVVGITVAKMVDAENMGFAIYAEQLAQLLKEAKGLDRDTFHLQCPNCSTTLDSATDYCPSCGGKLPKDAFEQAHLSPLATFCEQAITLMGIDPKLARRGYERWTFHKGSAAIRIFVYEDDYLFVTSPINLLPKSNLEPVLTYMLSTDFVPYKMGIEGQRIDLDYRLHLSDIKPETERQIAQEIANMAFLADDLDNMLVDKYGCEFSSFSKLDQDVASPKNKKRSFFGRLLSGN